MRSVLFLALAGCNGLIGVDKYVLDEAGAAVDGAGAESDTDGGAACVPTTTTTVIPQCSEVELGAQDHTAAADARLIRAPSDEKEGPYVPNCMTIRVGQSVTWTGNLTFHPLIPRENSTSPNPIETTPSGITTVQYTFPCPGDFNFSCKNHRDAMLGTVRVLPR
jgi:plastocyanin